MNLYVCFLLTLVRVMAHVVFANFDEDDDNADENVWERFYHNKTTTWLSFDNIELHNIEYVSLSVYVCVCVCVCLFCLLGEIR